MKSVRDFHIELFSAERIGDGVRDVTPSIGIAVRYEIDTSPALRAFRRQNERGHDIAHVGETGLRRSRSDDGHDPLLYQLDRLIQLFLARPQDVRGPDDRHGEFFPGRQDRLLGEPFTAAVIRNGGVRVVLGPWPVARTRPRRRDARDVDEFPESGIFLGDRLDQVPRPERIGLEVARPVGGVDDAGQMKNVVDVPDGPAERFFILVIADGPFDGQALERLAVAGRTDETPDGPGPPDEFLDKVAPDKSVASRDERFHTGAAILSEIKKGGQGRRRENSVSDQPYRPARFRFGPRVLVDGDNLERIGPRLEHGKRAFDKKDVRRPLPLPGQDCRRNRDFLSSPARRERNREFDLRVWNIVDHRPHDGQYLGCFVRNLIQDRDIAVRKKRIKILKRVGGVVQSFAVFFGQADIDHVPIVRRRNDEKRRVQMQAGRYRLGNRRRAPRPRRLARRQVPKDDRTIIGAGRGR